MSQDRLRMRLLAGASLLVFVLALAPALAPWPLSGHSAALDLQRAEAWHRAVVGGDWLPRWLPDLYAGYGSPMFNYYAPLPYALGELARALGASPLWAPKLVLALLWLAGAAGAAALARRLFGAEAGLVAFGLWAAAPYLLVDLYVRSALGEIAGLALLPWAIVSLLARGFESAGADGAERARAIAAAASAFALLIVAHNIVALLAAPALALVAFAAGDAPRAAARGARLTALLAGLALSAFYWLPALAEKDLVLAEESLTRGSFDVERNLLPPSTLVPWGRQLEIPADRARRIDVRLGLAFWIGIVALPWSWRRLAPSERRRAAVCAAVAFGLLVAATSWLAPLWRLPLARFVQFPFRLLGPASLAGVLAAAAVVAATRPRFRLLAGAGLLAAGALAAQPMTALARYGFVERATLETRPSTRAEAQAASADPALIDPLELVEAAFDRRAPLTGTARDDYLPRTVAIKPAPVPEAVAAIPPPPGVPLRLLTSARRGTRLGAEVAVDGPATLLFHQFHFPGWKARVDGAPREVRAEPGAGRLALDLRPGDRRIEVEFGDTPVRRAADLVSLTAALAFALALALGLRRGRRSGSVVGAARP